MSLASIERFLEGEYAVVACPSERDFYDLWRDRGLDRLAPIDSAIVGGLLADRLPWVFSAGYQATLRNAFASLPEGGWAAFAATEDARDPAAHPPVTLDEDRTPARLNGCKAWIAHSALVDHLIVTISDPGGDKRRARGTIVGRADDGVVLTHRERPGFLAAMSQGFAAFEQTPIGPAGVFGFEPIRQFGRTEAKFVMLAASAFLVQHTEAGTALRDRLIALAAAITSLLAETETSRQVYAAIDREFQACVDAFEATSAPGNVPDYADDCRLFRMYTARIQRREGYARAEAAERRAGAS